MTKKLELIAPSVWLRLPLEIEDGEQGRIPPSTLEVLVLSQPSLEPHAELLQNMG